MKTVILLSLLHLAACDEQKPNAASSVCSGVPGIPGIPGHNGQPGRDGFQGEKGERGVQGAVGPKGASGKIGHKGERGLTGEAGPKGHRGSTYIANWKQCAWDRRDFKDTGIIQECSFRKSYNSTALRVAYAANLVTFCGRSFCCGRWYITFNGVECSSPLSIEGLVFVDYRSANPGQVHRHRQTEGFCENVPAGIVTIAAVVGNCKGMGTADRDSGSNSASRLMIEEYPPAQI
ncbi:collagen triple helix repeat-containing protein 1-like isoform X2 [Oscarella lobularis]|uniref:collagen triple helix repeat-containing protein 1-like isoform X2 n=1 Tax=Oscarella lobularis TaxID=121494 RepID=UPI003313E175